jgi:hypothetical protein
MDSHHDDNHPLHFDGKRKGDLGSRTTKTWAFAHVWDEAEDPALWLL